jgi:hypothetical protein
MNVKPRSIFFQIAVCFGLLLGMSGCDSGGIRLGTVSGHVTKGGKPQQGINVVFEPANGGRGSEALTDANGYYELMFADRKGAVLGQHQVTVKIRARFNEGGNVVQPAQKFVSVEREVQSGSNTFDFDIAENAPK